MLENLKQLVTESAQDAIVNNPDVPNEQNEAAIQAASGSIFDTLKDHLASGNLSGLVDAFKGGDTGNSGLAQQATSSFTEKLAGMGINMDSAKNIASSLIPGIMDKFVSKTNDPNDSSFDIKDVLSKISGPDGKFQLSDLTDLFTSKEGETGGIMDKIKGLFN